MADTDLNHHIEKEEIELKRPLEAFHTKISDIRTSISSNDNKYTAIILPDGTWTFLWWDGNKEEGFEPSPWIEHIRKFKDFYLSREVEICVQDSNYYDEDENPFYNIKYIVPEKAEDARKILDLKQKTN